MFSFIRRIFLFSFVLGTVPVWAVPPSPTTAPIDGYFANHFRSATNPASQCSTTQYMYGLDNTPATYMQPLCRVLNDFNVWTRTGNSGTDPLVNFLGTVDNIDLVIKTNNVERLRVSGANGRTQVNQAFIINNGAPTIVLKDTNQSGSVLYSDANKLFLAATNGPDNETAASPLLYVDLLDGSINMSGQLISTVQNPTPAFQIASNVKITNLNADYIDGIDSAILAKGAASSTINNIPKFTTTSNNIGPSLITDDGTNIGIGTNNPWSKLQIWTEKAIDINIDQGNTPGVTRYYKLWVFNYNNWELHISGTLAGHAQVEWKALVDLKFSKRDGMLVLGSIFGNIANSDLVAYCDNAASQCTLWLKTGTWALVNIDLSAVSGAAVAYNWIYQLTVPTGTLSYTLSTDSWNIIRMTNDGNVGIGTTSPTHNLEVVGSTMTRSDTNAANYIAMSSDSSHPTNPTPLFIGERTRGTYTAQTNPLSGDGLAAFITLNPLNGWYFGMSMKATENHTATWAGGKIGFTTIPNGSLVPQTRVIIDQNGTVGIGTTTPDADRKLHIVFSNPNADGKNGKLVIENTANTLNASAGIQFRTANSDAPQWLQFATNSGNWLQFNTFGYSNNPVYGGYFFNIANNSVTAMVVNKDTGNVGIGTTTPSAKLDVAGDILLSATNPTIAFNSGGSSISQPAANTLTLNTNGLERARIDSNGNVGIGTTTPIHKLSVTGTDCLITDCALAIRLATKNTINDNSHGTTLWKSDIGFGINNKDNTPMVLATNNTEKLRITADGNVGIGTTLPSTTLDVNGTANVVSTLSLQGKYTDFYDLNPSLRVVTGPGTMTIGDDDNVSLSNGSMYVKNNGNVGIGTTTPWSKLEVNGDITAIGTIVSRSLYGDFVVGWDDAHFYPVLFTPAPYGSTYDALAHFEVFRDNTHEGGSWSWTFRLEVKAQPGSWWHRNAIVQLLRYEVGTGYPYSDSVGDVSAAQFSGHIVVWLRWGATYHYRSLDPNTGNVLVDGNPTGVSKIGNNAETWSVLTTQNTKIATIKVGNSGTYATGNFLNEWNILTNGSIGIGTMNPGAKLEVNGSVKITDGTQWANKVLTSNAAGLATWQNQQPTTNFPNDIWVTSTPDGANRLYFASGGRTYYGSKNGYEWRSNLDANIGSLDNTGNLTINGDLGFTQANPTISAPSYFRAPGGAYFNFGPVYTEAALRARWGIQNDTASYLSLLWGTGGVTYVAGNMGIGTTTPWAKLDVAGAAKVADTFSITNTAWIQYLLMGNQNAWWTNNPSVIYAANGATIIGWGDSWNGQGGTITPTAYFADNGNVGIGTNSPGTKLDVAGDVTVQGKLIVDKLVNRTVMNVSISGSLLPDASAPMAYRDIGSNGQKWNDLYLAGNISAWGNITAPNFIGNLSGNASYATTAGNADTVDGYHASSFVIHDTAQAPYGIATNSINSAYSSAIQIRESNFAWAWAGTINEAPHLAFHWSGRVASQIMMPADGSIQIRNNPGTEYETLKAGAIYSNDSLVWSAGNLTNLNQLTNGPGYINNNNPNYYVTAWEGNGICFWTDCANYKISMGGGWDYQYGPVNDYSIKMQMNAWSPGRGFTWGRQGSLPIAGLNATSGDFQTAGSITAPTFIGNLSGNASSASSVAWTNVSGRPTWMTAANLIEDIGNFNLSRPSGFYQSFSGSNSPTWGTWYNMINVRHSNWGNDHGFQIAESYYDNNLWHRSYQGGTGNGDGTFTPWAKTWDSENDGPVSGLEASTAPWAGVTGKPTTALGFASDAMDLTSNQTVGGVKNFSNDISLSGKNAFKWSDSWLRLNQDGAFISWTYTPGLLRTDTRLEVGADGATFNATNNGNVGIWRINPQEKLDIAGNILLSAAIPTIGFNAGGSSISQPAANNLTLNTSSLERVRVDNNGNVGIGTTTPGTKLDVAGDLTVQGKLIVDKLVNRSVTNVSISGSLLPDASAPMGYRDIGSNGQKWNDLYLAGNIAAGGTITAPTFIGNLSGNATSATTAGTANSVVWTNVSGRPSTVSAWTNDSGYITSTNPNYYVTAWEGNGICFWQDCTNYKISMGWGWDYQYGPVNDYSIKMQMNSWNPGRGFTWGRQGSLPIAGLNATSGDFQTAGNITAPNFIGNLSGNATYAATAGWVAWTNVSGKPNTALGFASDAMDTTTIQTLTNGATKYFTSNKWSGSYVGGSNTYGLEAFSSDGGAAGMSFHRGWAYAVNMGLDPDNVLRIGGWSAASNLFALDMWGNMTTAWYLRAGGNVYTDANYGYGLVGRYDATRYQWVFAMSDAYKLPADGTSPGNLYGIAWTHQNVWGESKAWLEHQALFMMNWVTQTAIGNGIWTKGNLSFGLANPTISASSYITIPGWAYFNGGTVYTAAAIQARWGIHNDTDTYLSLLWGTSGNTYVSGNLGIGTTAPWVKLDVAGNASIAGTLRIAGGTPGDGKVLTSDASGNATWKTPTSGGGSVYPNMADDIAIFPNYNGTGHPPYWETFSTTHNINAKCTSWMVELKITDREAWDWPAVGTTYMFGGSYRSINGPQTLFEYWGNSLYVDVGATVWSAGELNINTIAASYYDGSPGNGWVQMTAKCAAGGETVLGTMCDTNTCANWSTGFDYAKDVTYYNQWGRGEPTEVRIKLNGWYAGDWMNGGQPIDYLFWANFPLKFNKNYVVYNANGNWMSLRVDLNALNQVHVEVHGDDGSAGDMGGPLWVDYEVNFGSPNLDRSKAVIVADETVIPSSGATYWISAYSEAYCNGTVVDISSDRSAVCRVAGSSCNSIPNNWFWGWRTAQSWTTTTARTVGWHSIPPCAGYGDWLACTTGSHPWGNFSPYDLSPWDACESSYYHNEEWACVQDPINVSSIVNEVGCY